MGVDPSALPAAGRTAGAPEVSRVGSEVGVVVCRGCCCGQAAKRPGIDHKAQLERLRALADSSPGQAQVVVSDCLGPCDQSNVLVVRPSWAGRRAGGRPAWFGLLDPYAVDLVEQWVAAGGPGIAPIPDCLQLNEIPRPASPTAEGIAADPGAR
jgi:(2Fe-2S) ferredoxin